MSLVLTLAIRTVDQRVVFHRFMVVIRIPVVALTHRISLKIISHMVTCQGEKLLLLEWYCQKRASALFVSILL